MKPSEFDPSIVRKNRRCSTEHCPHTALFFPWIEVFISPTRKSHPLQIETPRQYCPACRDKINVPDDMGNNWREVLAGADTHFKEKHDPTTARLFWLPLIIGEESEALPSHSQRLHD